MPCCSRTYPITTFKEGWSLRVLWRHRKRFQRHFFRSLLSQPTHRPTSCHNDTPILLDLQQSDPRSTAGEPDELGKGSPSKEKNGVKCGFSSCVRNIILVGSLLDDEGPSWRSHPSQRGSIQPSSSIIKPSPALSDHNQADPLRPASLSRRPTVRLPAYLSLDRRRSHHGGPTKTEIPGDGRVECAGEGVRNGLKDARAAR